MDFEIYCDESGLEALTDKKAHKYIAIGGIWFPSNYRNDFKEKLKAIKERYNVLQPLRKNVVDKRCFS